MIYVQAQHFDHLFKTEAQAVGVKISLWTDFKFLETACILGMTYSIKPHPICTGKKIQNHQNNVHVKQSCKYGNIIKILHLGKDTSDFTIF